MATTVGENIQVLRVRNVSLYRCVTKLFETNLGWNLIGVLYVRSLK